MKKTLLLSLIFAACNQHPASQKAATLAPAAAPARTVKKFQGVEFASSKDLSCGMPLSAGVEDTAHYDGKTYGFCSTECKDSFLLDPHKYLAKK